MKNFYLLTKTLLIAVMLLGGANFTWGADVNLFTANATANLSVPASTTDQELTSTNATIKGGKMFVTNGQAEAKGLIATAPDTKVYFVMTNGNTSFKVTSNHALKAGDKIKFDVYYNHDGGSTDLGLWFTTASSRPGSAPTASKAESVSGGVSKTLTYTVAEDDGICGQSTFYVYRSSGTTTYFNNVVITRDYTTLYSQDFENAETYTSGWTIDNTGRLAFQQGDHGTGKCLWLKWLNVTGNNGTYATFTLGSSYTAYNTADDYKLEFDFAMTANNNSNLNFVLQDASGNEICTFYAPSYSSTAGALKNGRIRVSNTDVDESKKFTYEQKRGDEPTYWNHVTFTSSTLDGTIVTIDDYDGTQISVKVSNDLKRFGKIRYNTNRSLGELKFDNIALSVYSETEIVPNPSAEITGVSGTSRTVTMTLGTGSPDGTVIKYYTDTESKSDLTTYSKPFTVTSAATYYYYAESTSSTKSEEQSINVTCGVVKLNAPTIRRSGNTVTISSDQSDVVANPSATIYYTYGAGDPVAYSSAITVAADATITAYASATGYTDSDNATRAVALFPSDVVKIINAPQNKSYESDALSGVDVVGTNATFQALMLDGAQWGGTNVYVPTSEFNWRTDNHWYFGSTSNVWLLVKNLKAGDIIVANTDYQASGLTNATYTEKYSEGYNFAYTVTADGSVEIAFKKPSSKMHYFYGLYVWSSRFVSKTITSAGWATYCSDKALDFSGSIDNLTKAYLVTGATGNTLNLKKITGTVPANTGILLEGEGEVLIPVTGSSSTDVSENKLEGVTANTEIAAEAGYVLMGSPKVGFYMNNNAFTVGANTAYLPADFASARMAFFGFDDEATGVQNLTPALSEGEGVVYNLRGQRVAQPTKGLYIVNGKKVVIK